MSKFQKTVLWVAWFAAFPFAIVTIHTLEFDITKWECGTRSLCLAVSAVSAVVILCFCNDFVKEPTDDS